MKEGNLDYHVGIIRGYMLALNAPTQVLHAVSVLLENYTSKAGPLIGESKSEESATEDNKSLKYKLRTVGTIIKPVAHGADAATIITDNNQLKDYTGTWKSKDGPTEVAPKKSGAWTNKEVSRLDEMLAEGRGGAFIAKQLGRSPAAVYSRIYNMKQAQS